MMDTKEVYVGGRFSTTVSRLAPYTEYVFRLRVCTRGGCTDSRDVSSRTAEAPPSDMAAPRLVSVSPSVVEVSWTEPRRPNGRLLEFRVLRDGAAISTTPATRFFFRDTGMAPGSRHSYVVVAVNAAGQVASPSAFVTTIASAPDQMQAPTVNSLSANSLHITWQPPKQSNGVLQNFSLLLDGVQQFPAYAASTNSATLLGLQPYR